MKVLHEGKGYVLQFMCDDCGSSLEATRDEVRCVRLGDDEFEFHCPVCDEKRRTQWDLMRKKYL